MLVAQGCRSGSDESQESCHVPCREDETGLLRYFFGEQCNGRMSLVVFDKFLHDLHSELDKLEFQHYDPDSTVRSARTMFCYVYGAKLRLCWVSSHQASNWTRCAPMLSQCDGMGVVKSNGQVFAGHLDVKLVALCTAGQHVGGRLCSVTHIGAGRETR